MQGKYHSQSQVNVGVWAWVQLNAQKGPRTIRWKTHHGGLSAPGYPSLFYAPGHAPGLSNLS